MWKQFLNKLPRTKSARDGGAGDSGQCSGGGNGNPIQRTSSVLTGGGGRSASTIKRMSSAVFPSSVVAGIEPLVAFKDVSSSERHNLFVSKLSLCYAVFDFSDPAKSSAKKEIKRQALLDAEAGRERGRQCRGGRGCPCVIRFCSFSACELSCGLVGDVGALQEARWVRPFQGYEPGQARQGRGCMEGVHDLDSTRKENRHWMTITSLIYNIREAQCLSPN